MKKWGGAKLNGPPRQSFLDCLSIGAGAFETMLTILMIAASVEESDNFNFKGGWLSSTLCIVRALTPAPVGQPRQIFAGHLWNMIVGMICRHIPSYCSFGLTDYWPPLVLWKQAFAVALSISGQAYLGILHPPSTGLSITFVSNPQYSWGTIASVMISDMVLVVLAIS